MAAFGQKRSEQTAHRTGTNYCNLHINPPYMGFPYIVWIFANLLLNSKSEARNQKQILNLHPVESSGGGPPKAAFHRAGVSMTKKNDKSIFFRL
jgi:hypothetical protein